MSVQVFPLPAILFQGFFLTLAIAIESSVLHKDCQLSRKSSIEYATSINLLAAVFGWLFLFYYVGFFISTPLELKLINFIFFNRLSPDATPLLFITAFITFWVTYGIKIGGLNLLNKLVNPNYPLKEEKDETEVNPESEGVSMRRRTKKYPERRQALAILWGHAYSHSAILLILWLKDWELWRALPPG